MSAPHRRRRRAARTGALVLFAGLGLAACSSTSADALGHEACRHVEASLTAYAAGERAGDPSTAARDFARARAELRDALKPAALAGAGGGPWQALQTTLSESPGVPEAYLVTALRAQCAPGGS